jgi:hypothetical protein
MVKLNREKRKNVCFTKKKSLVRLTPGFYFGYCDHKTFGGDIKQLILLFQSFTGGGGDTSRHGSFSGPTNTSQISLFRIDDQDPYGFGLRVVGQQIPADPQLQQQQQQLFARVLWISPGGPAHRAGIKVGDKVTIL